MGRKDTIGKFYFRDAVRFAELMNSVLYQGEKIIRPENLEPMERQYPSLFGNADKSRDVFMKDVKYCILYSLELETESDYSMPERVMVYDACEYERQIRGLIKLHEEERLKEKQAGLQEAGKMVEEMAEGCLKKHTKGGYREKKSRINAEDTLLPVITAVLYLGMDHWKGKLSLSEMFQVPDKIRKISDFRIPEYDFHLAEADYMNPENFTTDLREFFQAMQCRRDKQKLKELFHSDRFNNLKPETVQVIAIHIDRKRLMPKISKEGIGMCQAFDELMEDMRMEGKEEGIKTGIEKGKREGIKEGERRERISIIRQMLAEGMEKSWILKISKCSEEEFAIAAGR